MRVGHLIESILLGACWMLPGCGESDTGDTDTDSDTDTDADSDTDSDTDTSTKVPSHDAQLQPIWNSRCTPCHISQTSGGLNMIAAYDAIVDRPATQVPTLDRIEPNRVDQSYLWHKLKGTQSSVGGLGQQMPLGRTMPQVEFDLIQDWIEAGAPQ